jgi:hypothetical protein
MSAEDNSPGSFDFDSYYGMSPFITPSFTTAAEANHFHHQDGPLYQSLRHRYEKEKRSNQTKEKPNTTTASEDEDDTMSSPELFNTLHHNHSNINTASSQAHKMRAQRTEDSDIELSDEEVDMEPTVLLQQQQRLSTLLPLHHTKSRRSRSPLSFPPAAQDKQGVFELMNPTHFSGPYPSQHKDIKEEVEEEVEEEEDSEQEPKPLSSDVQKLKNILTTAPVAAPAKPLPSPPRHHLLHTPVFQVVNANTIKDRYLFLFNDLLLICKPILDENIIVSGSKKDNRFRFRPNENSLFQVKNIVELGKLTLYLSKETEPRSSITSVELDAQGRPIIPPARKMHPIMASALRRFETNAAEGIAYLVDKNVLTKDPLSIANFLFKTPDLNRRQLGYYLSDLNNSDIYEAFLECFRLVGLRLDEALRILLTTFRLPSNWEALEYLIERFAKKWHDANQNVIKFHEDMVVKVVVAMLFLNAELWYDATSEKDVFWYARQLKERQDRQSKRKMSVIDARPMTMPAIVTKPSSSATTSRPNRESVTVEPLHYIMSMRANGNGQPTLDQFLDRWNYYDQYRLVPKEFMEEMYKSIQAERLETGWDNKIGKKIPNEGGVERPKVVSPSIQQGSQDVVITVIPHRLPTRLTKGVASDPITISIPAADPGLQIKLRGQDLVFEPNILDFSNSPIQTFTITGNTLGRTSLMFIKTGENAGNYVSPTLPRTKSVVVERPFMRFTFQIGFKHVDFKGELAEQSGRKSESKNRDSMINRKYTFSVETEQERNEWINALKKLSGHVNEETNENTAHLDMSAEARVALQVLKEVLLADEVKKGTARAKTPIDSTYSERHGRAMKLLLPKKEDDRASNLMPGTTNVVTKRGHEIVKLVVQNSMVPLVLGFLRHQIS